ncbi:MAG: hypothetical protein JRM82_01065 [Nitrososphaerota archaeon]|nr:hypothetical protein [Nitrososphaerota archaeon]
MNKMGMRGHTRETRSRTNIGRLHKTRPDKFVRKCPRGEEVLKKLELRSDTKVEHLYRQFNVTSWNLVLKKVFAKS